jgi:Family of unknown function (DUF6174)
MAWSRLHRTIAIAALATLGSCSSSTQATSELTVARQRWEAGRPSAYDYTLGLSCFCPTEITRSVVIVVNGNTVESRKYADTGETVAANYNASFPSLDGLFDVLVQSSARKPAVFDATYHPSLGYPTRVAIDFAFNTADDEMWYTITNFHAR